MRKQTTQNNQQAPVNQRKAIQAGYLFAARVYTIMCPQVRTLPAAEEEENYGCSSFPSMLYKYKHLSEPHILNTLHLQ